MENNINNQNKLYNMDKLILSIFLFFTLISSGFSATLTDDVNTPTLIDDLKGVNLVEIGSYLNLVFTNLTFEVTPSKNYNKDTSLMYFVYNNNNVDLPFVFQVIYKDEGDNLQAIYTELNLSASSTTSFYVETTKDLEYIDVFVRCLGEEVGAGFNGSTCGAGYQIRENILFETPEGVNSIFSPLINAVVDLVNINVGIWKILYYVFIMILVLSAIGGLVLLGFKYYNWAEKHDMYKLKNSRK